MSSGRRLGVMDGARKIIHVDMDAFYASVEQRDDLALRGRPVVVAWRGSRSVVCAASYEARRFGVRSAMPALRAERLCPDAVFVPPDFNRYRTVSRQVRGIFARYTSLIEPLSLDEAYLDVSADPAGMGSATATAQAIRAAIREELDLTASAGVAPNKFLAKLASDWRKPDGLFVIRPEQAAAVIASLPVGRIPGVGQVMQRKLEALGYHRIGDLAVADITTLTQRFGKYGQRLHELAQGRDDHEVKPDRPVRSVSSEDTFAEDLPLSALEPAIRSLAAKTWRARGKTTRVPRTVVLKLKTSDFRVISRHLTPEWPPDSAEALVTHALALRARVGLPSETRYRLVGVGLTQFIEGGDVAGQAGLFPERCTQVDPC